jgi:hypothetical protein
MLARCGTCCANRPGERWRKTVIGSLSVFSGVANQMLKRLGPKPDPGARLTLVNLVASDESAIQSMARPASWAGERRLFDLQRLGDERVAAMVAKLCAIADSGQAVGTDGVEVLFAEREIGATELAARRPIATRPAARRAAHDRGIVPLRLRNRHDCSTSAAEPAADRPSGCNILPPTGGTGHEQSHDEPS